MTTLPPIVPPLNPAKNYHRNLGVLTIFDWLSAGWTDLMNRPGLSFAYGLGVLAVSIVVISGMWLFGWVQILFPALAGFMVVGPFVSIGLYEKSRALSRGEKVTLARMIFVKAKSGGQVLFAGALLVLLMMVWMRAAVIIYALFFGVRPFPGLDHIVATLLTTPSGWLMLIVGTAVGALFAALSFSISVFSIPMLLDKNVDVMTAVGSSMVLVWNNRPLMICWGALVAVLFVVCILTGLLGLIVIFPLLGHASWHAYEAMQE